MFINVMCTSNLNQNLILGNFLQVFEIQLQRNILPLPCFVNILLKTENSQGPDKCYKFETVTYS